MLSRYDINLFRKFLQLAKTQGTDVIKVVVGDEPNSWIVRTFDEHVVYRLGEKEEKEHEV